MRLCRFLADGEPHRGAVEGDEVVDRETGDRRPLAEVNRGFELMEAQDGVRSVIQFG